MSNSEPPFDPSLNPLIGGDPNATGPFVDLLNKIAAKLGLGLQLSRRFDHRNQMVSVEQVTNFHHLIDRIVSDRVPGAFVELGCYIGSTAAVIGTVLRQRDADREFHVYDRFDIELGGTHDIEAAFQHTFEACSLELPTVHAGDLRSTVPNELPASIAFAHIDLGTGGGLAEHASLLIHCLGAVYPRLSQGGVIVLMDYHVPGVTVGGFDANPGVRLGADLFFQDKPETIKTLFGGPCSHAYIRKT